MPYFWWLDTMSIKRKQVCWFLAKKCLILYHSVWMYIGYMVLLFIGCPHNKGLSFWFRVRIGPQNCVHLCGHGETKAQNYLVQRWTGALWPSLPPRKFIFSLLIPYRFFKLLLFAWMIGFEILSSNQKFSFHNLKPLVCICNGSVFWHNKTKKEKAPTKSMKLLCLY